MSLLDRLAHARAVDRLASHPPARPEPAARRAAPTPSASSRAPTSVPFVRRERSFELEPAAERAPNDRRAGSFGDRREGLRATLLGGCLAGLRLPSGPALARDLVCLGAPTHGTQPVFVDTETTGLGGASVAFVVGVAWIDGSRLRCVQWTLAQCSGEAELLAELLAQLDALGPAPLVTFNGASFDLPLLRARARRHGLAARALDAEHVDLLHPARRLHGRRGGGAGGDCKLTTLERTLLGVVRRGDIDSASIPEVFWSWLQAPHDLGAQRRLAAVCDHNLADLASLPALAAKLAATIREPDDLDRAVRAARHLERIGAAEQARLVLARCVEGQGGSPATVRSPPSRAPVGRGDAHADERWREAALRLATFERRAGDRQRAAALWRAAYLADPGCPEACEAWAKHLEHDLRDFTGALRVARGSRQPCERRVARLEARLGRAQPASTRATTEPAGPAGVGVGPRVEVGGNRSARVELRTRVDQTQADPTRTGPVVRYRLLR